MKFKKHGIAGWGHTENLSTHETETGDHKFRATLGYIVTYIPSSHIETVSQQPKRKEVDPALEAAGKVLTGYQGQSGWIEAQG